MCKRNCAYKDRLNSYQCSLGLTTLMACRRAVAVYKDSSVVESLRALQSVPVPLEA